MRINKGQILFAIFLLLPGFLEFLLPLFLFKPPLDPSYYHNAPMNFQQLIHAFFIAMVWFTLAFLIIIFPSRKMEKTKIRYWDLQTVKLTIFVFSLLGALVNYCYHFIVIPAKLYQIVYPFTLLSTIAIFLCVYYIFISETKQKMAVFYGGFFLILNTCSIILSSILSSIALFIIISIISIAYAIMLLNISFKKIIVLLLFMALICALAQTAKVTVRTLWDFNGVLHRYTFSEVIHGHIFKKEEAKNSDNIEQVLKANADNFLTMSTNLRFFHNPHFLLFNYIMGQAIYRLKLLDEFAYVVAITPKDKPFLYGKTYKMLPLIFIPHLLWANKPVDHYGVWYGQTYGFVEKNDNYTTSAMALPIEAWINFGWLGIFIAALIYGLILRFLWLFFIGEHPAIGNIMIGMVIVYNAVQIESDAYLVAGTILHSTLVYWVLDVLIRWRHVIRQR